MEGTFAAWLADQLRDRGWRQKDLAVAVGVTQQTASRWLAAQTAPSGIHALALARVFGVTAEEVVGRLEQALGAPDSGQAVERELARLRARVEQLEAQLRRRA